MDSPGIETIQAQPRSITTVIDNMLNVIPKTEKTLVDEVTNYKNSLWNKAPELLQGSECWLPLQNILSKNIPTIDKPWKQQLLKIFNDQ